MNVMGDASIEIILLHLLIFTKLQLPIFEPISKYMVVHVIYIILN
jgi:hypothetical protein